MLSCALWPLSGSDADSAASSIPDQRRSAQQAVRALHGSLRGRSLCC